MLDEGVNGILLRLSKICIIILEILIFRYIAEELLRIYQILVHIIEITQEHITPEYEFIQALGIGIQPAITFIQFYQQTDSP